MPGKQLATVAGTTAVGYLRDHNAQVQEFLTPDQMFKALLDKKVDAVVSGARYSFTIRRIRERDG